MSTDTQDLSPTMQKETIAAYAAAKGMQVVASYEDEGRSGVHLKNRPALLRLLRDVIDDKTFSAMLVYDVSRWGRFQDTTQPRTTSTTASCTAKSFTSPSCSGRR